MYLKVGKGKELLPNLLKLAVTWPHWNSVIFKKYSTCLQFFYQFSISLSNCDAFLYALVSLDHRYYLL